MRLQAYKEDQKVLLNVMETGILSDVKAEKSKSVRQTTMDLSIYATSNDTSNLLAPLLSRFIKLNLPGIQSRNIYRSLSKATIPAKLDQRNHHADNGNTHNSITINFWDNFTHTYSNPHYANLVLDGT